MTDLSSLVIPEHIAVIMDGNGRWAQAHGEERSAGHVVGAHVTEELVEIAARIGVKYFTVYAFSTENWKRSKLEVDLLFELFDEYLKILKVKSRDNNIKCHFIGSRKELPDNIIKVIEQLEEDTKDYTKMTFNIALNYGGRNEIARAVEKIATDVKEGRLSPEDIDEQLISDSLDTAGMPDPDLLIRTGGEERISNFLIWQQAYTEYYFTDVCWPDFNYDEFIKAIEKYNRRDRRFGGVNK